jgi:hypothetical protein
MVLFRVSLTLLLYDQSQKNFTETNLLVGSTINRISSLGAANVRQHSIGDLNFISATLEDATARDLSLMSEVDFIEPVGIARIDAVVPKSSPAETQENVKSWGLARVSRRVKPVNEKENSTFT